MGGSIWLSKLRFWAQKLSLKTLSSILELLVRGGGLDTIPKGRSIAHIIFDNQNAVFLLFDIETAGEIAGIVQIFSLKRTNEPSSAQLFPQIRRHVRIMTFHF